MPNHVMQHVTFKGPGAVQIIKDYLTKDDVHGGYMGFDFMKVLPSPESIRANEKGVLSEEEYSWRWDNWGTKWRGYEVEILNENGADEIELELQTAWSSGAKVYYHIASEHGLTMEGVAQSEDFGEPATEFTIRDGQLDISVITEQEKPVTRKNILGLLWGYEEGWDDDDDWDDDDE